NLSMFYHKDTKEELENLRLYLKKQKNSGEEDNIDRWIRMVATNRLTGHSSGFFSVYTLPPNQAVSAESQIKINFKRQQVPPYRNIKKLILKKSKSLLRNVTKEQKKNLLKVGKKAIFLQKDARNTPKIANKTVQLTITSPPFLNIVQYSKDNWLRCWFNSINAEEISKKITMAKTIKVWTEFMIKVFQELYRITKFNGWVAFEVGEIQKGKIKLDDYIVPIGIDAGFKCRGILINSQKFTKTSNIWGIKNNLAGTNTNRIVLFEKTH
ncbi:MAG: site-specific DNA-methyltransferase, partial [archaeon]|nr:site-specific DNA-methyltransferase [archaeon]